MDADSRRRRRVRSAAGVGAVLIGTAACSSSTTSSSTSTTAATGGSTANAPAPVSSASTSTRGVTATTINVVFPEVSLSSLAGQEGFAQDAEYGEQTKAIDFYVNQINESGGINGRRINPIIATFDPTNESQMRAL